jgi:monoamine oxidase
MDRRTFIGTGLQALSALANDAPALAVPTHSNRSRRVLVLGAGMAGLTAALELMQQGHEVIVFEGRDWAGGRVHTLRKSFSPGLYAEAGAVDFSENYKLTMAQLKGFGLSVCKEPVFEKQVVYFGGERHLIPPVPTFGSSEEERRLGFEGTWNKYVVSEALRHGDPYAPDWTDEAARQVDRVTLNGYLRSRGVSLDGVARFATRIDGADYDHVSALESMHTQQFYAGWTDTLRVCGGNDRLPQALASRLGNRLHVASKVVAIAQTEGRVEVSVENRGLLQRLVADRAVVALPISCVRDLHLEGLSARKRDAIARVKYERIERVYLETRTRFWNQAGIAGTAATDLPIELVVDHSSLLPGTRGILEAQMSARHAQAAAEMPESELIRWTSSYMDKVHPGTSQQVEGGATWSWDERDPYSRGAFAYYAPGEMTTLFPDVSLPDGRLHFAGEHTSVLSATIEGAVHSGVRAAREIEALA